MSLASNLKEARINKGLKQEELAKLVGKTKNVISSWERGDNKPDANTIFDLCDILNVDANYLLGWENNQNLSLSIKEQDHIKKYRSLSDYDKGTVDQLLDRLSVKELDSEYSSEPIKYIDRYINIASAGTGEYLVDDIPSEKIQVSLDCKADFAVGVHGESMKPTYHDGETVLVKKQSELNIGDIGIFIINGDCYIKECGGDRLISHNKNYPDIDLKDGMDFRVVGKVVGKLD